MNSVITVGALADVLAYVPTSFGFQPTDSLVAMSLRSPRGRVGLVLRIDLADAVDAAHAIATHLVRDGADRCILATYSDDAAAAEAARTAVREALDPIRTRGAVVTSNGYGWDDEPGLSPMSDLDASEVAAQSVYNGVAIRTSREDLIPRVTDAEAIATARAAAASDAPDALGNGQALAAWRQAVDEQTNDPRTLGRLARTLTDPVVRDAVLVLMVTNSNEQAAAALCGDEEATRQGLELLTSSPRQPGESIHPWAETLALVAAHQDTEPVAAPAWTLWTITQWWTGAGAAANVGIDKALMADDTHRLAHLMADCLSAGIGPGWTRRQ